MHLCSMIFSSIQAYLVVDVQTHIRKTLRLEEVLQGGVEWILHEGGELRGVDDLDEAGSLYLNFRLLVGNIPLHLGKDFGTGGCGSSSW